MTNCGGVAVVVEFVLTVSVIFVEPVHTKSVVTVVEPAHNESVTVGNLVTVGKPDTVLGPINVADSNGLLSRDIRLFPTENGNGSCSLGMPLRHSTLPRRLVAWIVSVEFGI
ncbi:hypothetical protein Pcinc_021011 [Petrolisthes cinctipes]|uniref:Secreted protein n=1 Tax=Petrolisthes cinctipes TaxID=88211 RepID=A0AAE1FJ41_PETCI|nr:hypothetical protein Pcinc_021011 [Petrolisthes cinctipes]